MALTLFGAAIVHTPLFYSLYMLGTCANLTLFCKDLFISLQWCLCIVKQACDRLNILLMFTCYHKIFDSDCLHLLL